MIATDFEYDGQYLSDYGFIIYGDNVDETVNSGSKIVFNKIPLNSGKYHSLSSTKFEECYTTTFSVCKDPDIYDVNERFITDDEYRDIKRWLNRREFLKFCFIGDGEAVYFYVSFQVNKILVGGNLVGLQLTLESNSPFGYGQEQTAKWTVATAEKVYLLSDISDEIGYTYPDIKIVINKNGNFEMYNKDTDCRMIIKNCSAGETITIKGDTRIIETDNEAHRKTIYNDFNFQYFTIANSIDNRSNRITVTLPSEITIKYTPIIK